MATPKELTLRSFYPTVNAAFAQQGRVPQAALDTIAWRDAASAAVVRRAGQFTEVAGGTPASACSRLLVASCAMA